MISVSRFVAFGFMVSVFLGTWGSTARAKEISLIAPMSGFSLLDPTYPPGPGGAKPYSQTDGALQWSVGPWGSPGKRMPNFTKVENGNLIKFSAHTQSTGVDVLASPNERILKLYQNGSSLACTNPKTGKPLEFDFFVKPNPTTVKAPRRSGYFWPNSQGLELSSISDLNLNANVTFSQGVVTPSKHCKANLANTVFSVIMMDRSVHPTQVFFYQLLLSHLCGSNPEVKLNVCKTPKAMGQFITTNPFGTDDVLPLVGVPWLVPGQPNQLHINLLPRLIEAIQTSRGKIDRDLSHWEISSIYMGGIIYGDVKLDSAWKDVSLTATSH